MNDAKPADIFRLTTVEPGVHVATIRAAGEDVQRFQITDDQLRLAAADATAMAYFHYRRKA